MKRSSGVSLDLLLFASPVYWPDPAERTACAQRIAAQLETSSELPAGTLRVALIDSAESADYARTSRGSAATATALLPMSGGVQPWMLACAQSRRHLALLNGYLPGLLRDVERDAVMHRNAHPACTDFHAHRRLADQACEWLDSVAAWQSWVTGWQGAQRLRHATFLKIGETEPWVINSCRSPERFAEKWGARVIPLEREAVYAAMPEPDSPRVAEQAEAWTEGASALVSVGPADISAACRVIAGMESLLERHAADGLSMACFAMIGEADTTSCLALSTLNDAASTIGACEGDLDAAATLFLLRAVGADFVWIGNPILHPGRFLELAHCTAPRCACGERLPYRLMRHHESGRGVAPEVVLPADQPVTLARIGDDLNQLAIHTGTTRRIDKIPTCHTQIRVEVADTRPIVDNLLGTHLVMSYGDWTPALRHAARFLDLAVCPADEWAPSPRKENR